MRWRTGRKVLRTVYARLGDTPSDGDPLIGVMDTPELAKLAAAAPELLERLKEMPCIVCQTAVGAPPKSLGIPGITECPGCKLARAAIAGAEP